MPFFTCDHVSLGYPEAERETRIITPDGSGYINIAWAFVWDGISIYPDCDGDVTRFFLSNTSQMTAWASLPAKKSGDRWFQIDPGAVIGPVTSPGQLQQNGIRRHLDIAPGQRLTFTQPTG